MNSAFGAPTRGHSIPLVLTVAATVVLTACGGGGGGDHASGSTRTISSTTSSSNGASNPGTPSTPTAPPARTLAAGAELPPTLTSPQPGSTAESGNDSQGSWEDSTSLGFVGPNGRFAFNNSSRWIFGSIRTQGTDWSFEPATISADGVTGEVNLIQGSGTLSAKRLLRGDYTLVGQTSKNSLSRLVYSETNALAVSQKDLAGKWSASSAAGIGVSFDIDVDGKLTGTTAGSRIGECSLTGTLLQTEPSTAHNMFDVRLKASDAAGDSKNACQLNQVDEYTGLGAVRFTPVSAYPEEGAYRKLALHVGNPSGGFMTNFLQKR